MLTGTLNFRPSALQVAMTGRFLLASTPSPIHPPGKKELARQTRIPERALL